MTAAHPKHFSRGALPPDLPPMKARTLLKDGKPLQAGDLENGTRYKFDPATGELKLPRRKRKNAAQP